jgi:cold-inducible RNA-binding protein
MRGPGVFTGLHTRDILPPQGGSLPPAWVRARARIEPYRLASPQNVTAWHQTTPHHDVPMGIGPTVKAPLGGAEVRTAFMARKLYVGNLPYSAGEQDLQQLFASAGKVEHVNVMRDNATGRARGFAFVEMASEEDAQAAISQFNNYSFGGRNLTVNEARPKPQGGGGGGFGGGGGRGGRREPRW